MTWRIRSVVTRSSGPTCTALCKSSQPTHSKPTWLQFFILRVAQADQSAFFGCAWSSGSWKFVKKADHLVSLLCISRFGCCRVVSTGIQFLDGILHKGIQVDSKDFSGFLAYSDRQLLCSRRAFSGISFGLRETNRQVPLMGFSLESEHKQTPRTLGNFVVKHHTLRNSHFFLWNRSHRVPVPSLQLQYTICGRSTPSVHSCTS